MWTSPCNPIYYGLIYIHIHWAWYNLYDLVHVIHASLAWPWYKTRAILNLHHGNDCWTEMVLCNKFSKENDSMHHKEIHEKTSFLNSSCNPLISSFWNAPIHTLAEKMLELAFSRSRIECSFWPKNQFGHFMIPFIQKRRLKYVAKFWTQITLISSSGLIHHIPLAGIRNMKQAMEVDEL